ncbi:Serine/threonine protein kinase [Nannocystis exedens]|uniref:Serine/threonine protein kinase n=1 Tax=Nannocystis exedens TaxID=54 RepID=A0A1I2HGZ5_9BACT|nr:serine/threonine-protein kinase [Nannocystis exedens]PCC67880.1 Serine/threonine-protein kinase PknB [Nannocystis exedens]SFF28157.1 Serine/threonine protein kinase [Nannocystis exedens]
MGYTDADRFVYIPTADKDIGHALIRDQVRVALFGGAAAVKIGRFEIERRLGRGGMGELFLARDPQLRRRVAVKLLRPGWGPSSADERMRREAQALAQISHPNVVEVYEVGEHEGRPFVAMEYVEGRTLQAWRDEVQPSWREVVEVHVETGRGLLAAHRAGLVHRNFKPDNVLVSEQSDGRRVRVLDFGLARLAGLEDLQIQSTLDETRDQALTRPGTVLGTLAYMSPEQLRGEVVDAASDQFSFCVALYRAPWGEEPFAGRSVELRVAAMTLGPASPPVRRGMPRRLRKIVERGLACEPGERWPSMDELLIALERVIPRKRAWPALTAAGLVMGVGVGIAYERVTPEDPCRHVELRSAELWTDAHAERARARFEASGLTFAGSSFTRVHAALGRWTAAWSEQRMGVCRNGEEPGRRASCLDGVHAEVASLVDAMIAADERTITHAVESLAALPSLRAYDDDEAIRLGLAPVPEALEDELARRRKALAEARTLALTGHLREAGEAYAALERDTAEFDYKPFAAELEVARVSLRLEVGEPSASLPLLESAAKQAERARHDRLAAHAWTLLAHWSAGLPNSPREDAVQRLERAEIAAARLDSPPELEARLHCIRGVLLGRASRQADARAAFERGLELLGDLAVDEQEWRSIGAVANQWRPVCVAGLAELHTGREAIDLAERALAEAGALYGEDHPKVGHYEFALARLLLDSDAAAERRRGVALLEHVAAVWLAAHDESALAVGDAYVSLATVAIESGDVVEARRNVEAARGLYARALAPGAYQHAGPLLAAGLIESHVGNFGAALAHYDRARALLPDEPMFRSTRAEIDFNRARCLFALGRLDDASASFEALRGPEESRAEIEVMLAAVALRRGELARARTLLDGLAAPDLATSRVERGMLGALVDLRARREADCGAIAAGDIAALASSDAYEINRLLIDVGANEDERRCLGWTNAPEPLTEQRGQP